MKLTTKKRWGYKNINISSSLIKSIAKREGWMNIVKNIIPNEKMDFLELGCAPGLYSAALCKDTKWECAGIDYSENSTLYLESMQLVGKKARLFEFDLFEKTLIEKFDIVASFGLVEHFRGGTLDKIFMIHDYYVKPGGYVIINVPNFTGFQYVWHYIFDKPDLDNHNIDVMQPSSMQWFEKNGYEVLYSDYVGIMRLWGNSGWTKYWIIGKMVAATAKLLSFFAIVLSKVGIKLQGQTFSPNMLFVAKKFNR